MQNNYSNHNNVNEKFSLFKRQYTKIWVRLIRVFKQQFLIFFWKYVWVKKCMEIHVMLFKN